MLDVIRKRKRSWLVLLLLGVGVLAFVMVGVGPQGGQEQVVTIAEVNGDKITYTELERHYYRMLQTYRNWPEDGSLPADLGGAQSQGPVAGGAHPATVVVAGGPRAGASGHR